MRWAACHTADFSEQALRRAYECLSPSRKEHIDTLRKPEDKIRSLCGELLVEKLLAECGITEAKLHRYANGQPYLSGCDLFVSISHSEDMVACAVSDAPVGIDIQKIRPISPALSRHLCTPEEAEYAGTSLHRLYEIWTGKEAWFKKQGTGITDLKSVNILPLSRQVHILGDYMLQIM